MGDNTPTDEILFLIVNNLCSLYQGINPIQIQREPYVDVIDLFSDVRRMQIRDSKKDKKVIKRYASDDAGWW